ncbi:MAG: Gfo/Idh/MocA family oxidoreductase [Oscillospiraceae bacterium]|nr:Gfo/Idh/MocA family oxidoreductase [Oscillospiraceae bacterium]
MKKVKFAILGMGDRGTVYASKILLHPEEAEVVAIADLRQAQLDKVNRHLQLPRERIFHSAEELLAQPKLADVMIIASQDQQHCPHAVAAMEAGYDLLLEKPIASKLEDVVKIAQTAKRLGRRVLVCHVLRYTAFYKEVRRIIREGLIGDVQLVEASEAVGYFHQAHSFVRGNWHNSEKSSPMILAKCCHDMDILQWVIDKKCLKLNSFGSLSYFTPENAPEGSAERCFDCKAEDCPYHAPTFYISRIPGWPANIVTSDPTEENVLQALRDTDYGRCVFRMDNDVVDHQTVHMLMEDGVTIIFQMSGFNNIQTRDIRVLGTKGELWGHFKKRELYYQQYGKEPVKIDLETLCKDFTGHGGGDGGIIQDMIRLIRGEDFDTSSITYLENSVESHYMAFAAEKSRVSGGELIHMDAFVAEVTQ